MNLRRRGVTHALKTDLLKRPSLLPSALVRSSGTTVAILALTAGIFSIVAALRNWDWFFENWRATLFVRLFGRDGARVLYVILGIGLIILSISLL